MPRISRRVGLASVTALLRFRVFANTTTTRAPHPPSHDAMTSPFHAGDVGSAIALAKAKGFPLLVAVPPPGDASSDAFSASAECELARRRQGRSPRLRARRVRGPELVPGGFSRRRRRRRRRGIAARRAYILRRAGNNRTFRRGGRDGRRRYYFAARVAAAARDGSGQSSFRGTPVARLGQSVV